MIAKSYYKLLASQYIVCINASGTSYFSEYITFSSSKTVIASPHTSYGGGSLCNNQLNNINEEIALHAP